MSEETMDSVAGFGPPTEEEARANAPAKKRKHHKHFFARRSVQVVLGLIVLLVGLRIALPYIVLHVVNDRLSKLDGYWGHVDDVDIALYRGAYRFEGIRIVKTGGRVPVPFFRAPAIDISVEWKSLFDGKIVAEVLVSRPQLNFVNSESNARDQTGGENDWRETVQDLVPLKINRFAIRGGAIHFRDFGSDPPINLYVQRINFTAYNLTNTTEMSRDMVARMEGTALAMHSGRVRLNGRVDPYAEKPTFTLKLSMRGLNLPELNPFLEAYAGIDAEGGKFNVYTELTARNGRFRGYVKPIIEDAEIFDLGGETEGFFTQAWEAIVAVASEIIENHGTDTIATRIPLSGRLDDPDVDIWTTIGQLLKNAFIRALQHGLESLIR